MADKSISELVAAEKIKATDLFVLEQDGTAKKVTGQILENWLVSFADGHGGIQSIEKAGTTGLVDTYRITLADTTTFDFVVTNGKSITGITKTATAGLVDTYTIRYNDGTESSFVVANGRGIKSWEETVDGLSHTHTITYNDGTSDTFTVKDGEKGDKGDNAYTWIKYASQEPTSDSHSMGDVPDNWMGVYTGTAETAPTDWTAYQWYCIKGEKGTTGDPAELVSAVVEYQVSDSGTIIPSGVWSTTIPVVAQGKYLWTRTTSTFNSGSPVEAYSVARMGIDGAGSVSSVAGVSPDEDGNVTLTAENVGALPTTGGAMTGPIDMQGQTLTGLNQPTEDTQAAGKGYVDTQVSKAAPVNLLDNSDFRDPVNQRGASAYTQDSGYTIDRWKMQWSGNGALSVEDGFIRLSRDNNSAYLYQMLPDFEGLSGKTLTIAARVRGDGQLGYRINSADTQNQIVIRDVEDWTTVSAVVQMPEFTADDLTSSSYGFSMNCASGKQLDVQWMAVYEGAYTVETLPQYRPKGYAHELMECMRYYQRYTGTCHYNGDVNGTATKIYFAVPVPIKPRITPSLTLSGDMFLKGVGGGGNYSLEEHPLSVTSPANVGNQVNLEMANPSATLFPGHSPAGLNIGNMVLELSADL